MQVADRHGAVLGPSLRRQGEGDFVARADHDLGRRPGRDGGAAVMPAPPAVPFDRHRLHHIRGIDAAGRAALPVTDSDPLRATSI